MLPVAARDRLAHVTARETRVLVTAVAARRDTGSIGVLKRLKRVAAGTLAVLLMTGGLVANVAAASGQGVPAPGALTPGVPAWVQVSVATVWIHPTSPRPLDGPALTDPARIGTWLGSMTVTGRLGLHGRIDTQMVYGRKVVVLSESGKWSRVAIPSQTGNHFPNGVIGWVPSAQLDTVGPRQPTTRWSFRSLRPGCTPSRGAWSGAAAYFSVTPPSCPSCPPATVTPSSGSQVEGRAPWHKPLWPRSTPPRSRVAPSLAKRGCSSGSPTCGVGQAVLAMTAPAWSTQSSPVTASCSRATRQTRGAPPSRSPSGRLGPATFCSSQGPRRRRGGPRRHIRRGRFDGRRAVHGCARGGSADAHVVRMAGFRRRGSSSRHRVITSAAFSPKRRRK